MTTWLTKILNELKTKRFYGKITLSFEAGKLVTLRREETIKPPKDLK
jgi:hypothetical protein